LAEEKTACCNEVCTVDAIVTVDARGQMVLPKEVREKMGLVPGGKVAVITRYQDGQVCCLLLVKAEDLANQIKGLLGPIFQDTRDV
jgi:AbrB family looped-hinge helix DNA binding protein